MRELTIIVPNTDFNKLNDFLSSTENVLRKYHAHYVFLHSQNKPDDVSESEHQKFVLVDEHLSYSEQITKGFESVNGDAVIILDMHAKHVAQYLEQLVVSWEKGAKIVRLKYQKAKLSFWDKIANFFVNIKNALCNIFLSMIGLSKDSNCYNTFQLFDKDVFNLIASMPEKNSYLRNSKCLSNFAEIDVLTDEKIKIAKHKMQWDNNLTWSLVLFCLFVTTLIVGIIVACVIKKDYKLTSVTIMLFMLVGFGGFSLYNFSKAYLKYKFNK